MSDVVLQLANIELDNSVIASADLENIYRDFKKNYDQLGKLKEFRSDYEKKNIFSRWWNKDKLQGAQLDSAEVQAEFSKTIGQLMLISIAQSKKLTEQQLKLGAQQGQLSAQAVKLEAQADELAQQHINMAAQNDRLERLVNDYFELKGLTRDGAEKLIEIARDVTLTKEKLMSTFNEQSTLLSESMQSTELRTQRALQSALASFEQISQSIQQSAAEQKKIVEDTLVNAVDAATKVAESAMQFAISKVTDSEKISALKFSEIDSQFVLSTQKITEVKDTVEGLADQVSSENKNLTAAHQQLAAIVEEQAAELSVTALSLSETQMHVNEQKLTLADAITSMSGKLETLDGRLSKVAYVVGGLGLAGIVIAILLHFQR